MNERGLGLCLYVEFVPPSPSYPAIIETKTSDNSAEQVENPDKTTIHKELDGKHKENFCCLTIPHDPLSSNATVSHLIQPSVQRGAVFWGNRPGNSPVEGL